MKKHLEFYQFIVSMLSLLCQKRNVATLFLICLYSLRSFSQNIGINNSNPQVSLDINGAVAHRSVTIDPFLNSINIPTDASFVIITGVGVTGPITVLTPDFIDGKRLLIQNLSSFTATLNPSSTNVAILSNETMEFICRNPGGYYLLNNPAFNSWLLKGNAGTNPTTNFIGTTDSQPLHFKVSSAKAGKIDLIGNTSFGFKALSNITPNSIDNTAIGSYALYSNKNGNGAVAIGKNAAYGDTSSHGIIAIGRDALFHNQAGKSNFAIGDSALFKTGLGSASLYIGSTNMGIGKNALKENTLGSNNMAIGDNALVISATNSGNTALGHGTLSNFNNGFSNVAVGASTLRLLSSGFENIGMGSFGNLIRGSENIGIGRLGSVAYRACKNIIIGGVGTFYYNSTDTISNNVMMGYRDIVLLRGHRNVLIGNNSGGIEVYGDSNSVLGDSSLVENTTGSNNVALGAKSGASNVTGSGNVFMGYRAGAPETGSNKLYIENSNADQNNALIYGDFAADSLRINGKLSTRNNAVVQGFTKLGGYEAEVPSIKMKKFSGTTGAAQGDFSVLAIPHLISNPLKILSVRAMVNYSSNSTVPDGFNKDNGYECNVWIEDTFIRVQNKAGNSANILSKPFTVLIIYEE